MSCAWLSSWISNFVEKETSVMACGKVPVLLIFWFTERWIAESCRFCKFTNLWCHSDIIAVTAPPPTGVQSSTFIVISCPSFGRHMWAGHEISCIKSRRINSVSRTFWGWGCYSCDVRGDITVAVKTWFCKLAEIYKTEKLLSAIALSVNQEISTTGTLPHIA